jgi:hypothetical protein
MSLKIESVPLQFYPARPTNWPNSRNVLPAKGWASEPKINGWRIIIDTELRQVWNRHGERFKYEADVLKVLAENLFPVWSEARFLDGEFLGLRTKTGKGSVVLFDSMDLNDSTSYDIRKTRLSACVPAFQDPAKWEVGQLRVLEEVSPDKVSEFSQAMVEANKKLGEDFFEGWVFKDRGAYPWQRTATAHSAQWIKDRYIVPRGDGL